MIDLTIFMKASCVTPCYVDPAVLPGARQLVGTPDPVRELLELVLAHLDLVVQVDLVPRDAEPCVSPLYRRARERGRG